MEPKNEAPKPVVWKLKKGTKIGIPLSSGDILIVTNEKLKNPTFIEAISSHERQTGSKIFNNVVVKA